MSVSLSQITPTSCFAEQSEKVAEVVSLLVMRMHSCDNVANPVVSAKGESFTDAQKLEQLQQSLHQVGQTLLSHLDELNSKNSCSSHVNELLELRLNIEVLMKASNSNCLTLASNLKEARNVPYGM